MANTIDADILLDVLSQKAITFLGDRLAPLSAFTTDFTTSELVQAKAVQVPVVSAGATTLTNPADFEAGDSTTSNVAVTVNHYSQPFHISSKEYNQKLSLELLAQANLQTLANKISDVWTALATNANIIPATGAAVAQASFAAANAKTLWGQIAKTARKSLLLDGVAFAQLAPSDKNAFDLGQSGAYGYDGIFCQTRWTGAEANLYGLAVGQEFIAIAAGIPMQGPGVAQSMVGQRVVTLPGLGLSVQVNLWVSTKTRALWCSYDLMFGAAVADGNAAAYIVSA
jgi:hypothetical protein